MKKIANLGLSIVMLGMLMAPVFAVKTQTASAALTSGAWTGTPTGYTKASDVNYDTSGKYMANWGARGEQCGFLTTKATSFYAGSYSYDSMTLKAGGTSQANAPSSNLYKALKDMMSSKHSYQTSYNATKDMYRYTDCVNNQSSNISSFYSGKKLTGSWDSAATWNREHTWPNSKGLGGNDENDIMMLRPTWVQENSSRGNTAYGESSGYFDPGEDTRGDCARIVLYVYTRWGNTNYMWGKSGVMESMNVLLEWMEEDPVDTWEMGRNDVVESITGTRNVFVDYPEYAWLLFGKSAPTNMVTPSGKASGGTAVPVPPSSTTPDPEPDQPSTSLTTPAEIMAAAYKLSSGEYLSGEYTLTGEITNIKEYDTSTTNIWLTMKVEGKNLVCYWMRDNANGDNKNLKVGDTITVRGTIKNHQGTVEFEKPTLISVGVVQQPSTPDNPGTSTEPDDGVLNTPAKIVNAAYKLAVGEALDGEYTLSGVIKEIKKFDESSNNICLTITVEGKDIYCFWMRDNASGANKNLAVGDTIEVVGVLKNVKGVVQFDKPTLISTDRVVEEVAPESSDGEASDTENSAANDMMAGCQSSLGVCAASMAILSIGALALKRKQDNE